MTGPEHYKAAEDDLRDAGDQEFGTDKERFFLDRAQIHATLALAAAVASHDPKQWKDAVS